MSPSPYYRIGRALGSGASGIVFQAVDEASGQQVAVKKSRVSQKVLRPRLQHESRVLSLLQGHPGIPAIYGYGHLPHFEYLALELLGPTLKERVSGPVSTITAARVVLQVLSALEHLQAQGLVHRDIKPSNILSSLTDPSRVVLIDFGICRCIKPGPPTKYDPFLESKNLIGTTHWASLNSHNGIELAPRDDLESFAYTALFLLRGDLPWRMQNAPGNYDNESDMDHMERVRVAKTSTSGATLSAGFPPAFGALLDCSRRLAYSDLPPYGELAAQFTPLAGEPGGALDWRAVGKAMIWVLTPKPKSPRKDDEKEEYEKIDHGSYDDMLGNYDRNDPREHSLTLPAEQAARADEDVDTLSSDLHAEEMRRAKQKKRR